MIERVIIKDMGKATSYYDWELRFRAEKKSHKRKKKRKKLTSIGINEEDLKNFLKQWKMNNLPLKKQK